MAKLGRRIQFDERSRGFPVRALLPEKKPRSYTWSCGVHLEQGHDACVGFAWAHELAARPAVNVVSEAIGASIYREAQRVDEWPGEDYGGTSILAGAKAVKTLGYMTAYRWGFSLQDLVMAVGFVGPSVLGVNWYEGMEEAGGNGFIHPTGVVLGGHAILCFSVSVSGNYFRLHNSWGQSWGVNGTCKVSFADMDQLLHEQGEACFPVGRKRL